MIVTAGTAWVQQESSEKQEIKPGDVIWTPPGVKHWHGATAATAMTHIAIQEEVAGNNVDWLEQVSEEEYKMTATPKSDSIASVLRPEDVRTVAPALERYTETALPICGNAPGFRREIAASLPSRPDRAQSQNRVVGTSQPSAR